MNGIYIYMNGIYNYVYERYIRGIIVIGTSTREKIYSV